MIKVACPHLPVPIYIVPHLHLMKRFSYKKKPAYVSMWNITAYRKRFDIYIRYKPSFGCWDKNTLVIARIHFYQTRKGHGASLLKFLCEVAEKYDIAKIAIEQENENSENFAKRYGFQEFVERQWIIDIEVLKNNLFT